MLLGFRVEGLGYWCLGFRVLDGAWIGRLTISLLQFYGDFRKGS